MERCESDVIRDSYFSQSGLQYLHRLDLQENLLCIELSVAPGFHCDFIANIASVFLERPVENGLKRPGLGSGLGLP